MPIATNNIIVSQLPSDLRARFDAGVRRMPLASGQVLYRPGERINSIYFVESGLACMSWGASTRSPDVAMIGREGMIGHSVALGVESAESVSMMRVAGSALVLPAAEFKALLQIPEFRQIALRYAHDLTSQIADCAFANATLPVLGRVARFLLLVSDRLQTIELAFTHDTIATALGCRRAGVTISIHILEGDGALKARRNRIVILDRNKLMAAISAAVPDMKISNIGSPAVPAEARLSQSNGAAARLQAFAPAAPAR